MTEPIRLVLSANQTADIIEQAGAGCHDAGIIAAIGPGSVPDAVGKLVLYFVPCESIKTADAAIRVARGVSFERKPRKPKASQATGGSPQR